MSGCWIDIFEQRGFDGARRRLCGPADYLGMLGGSPLRLASFGSIIVGSQAYILFFQAQDIHRTACWIRPGVRVGTFEPAHAFDSVRIYSRPPIPGDPGFDRYLQTIYNS